MAELFQTTTQNITQHLKAIYQEGELQPEATCKDFLQVRQEGERQVRRKVQHYSLDAILAVGYRVRSQRGTQFRIWATERLHEASRDEKNMKLHHSCPRQRFSDKRIRRIHDCSSVPAGLQRGWWFWSGIGGRNELERAVRNKPESVAEIAGIRSRVIKFPEDRFC